jgi:glycosyltransferase involved in cell wall biosynthesis
VTTNFNGGAYLEATIQSIVQQGYPNLEYILIDGGSTDNSLEIIQKYAAHFSYWVSEADAGQYHGIQKGFARSTGEIMAWLNSDDMLLPNALFSVAEIFSQFKEIDWLTGHPTEYTEKGQLINRIALPYCRWSKARYYTYDFQFIQQESTFWRKSLWEKAGGSLDLDVKQAGDLDLWARFFRHADLYTTSASLAGFRHRKSNQRSKDFKDDYFQEAIDIIRRERMRLSPFSRFRYSVLRVFRWTFSPFYYWHIPLLRHIFPSVYKMPPVVHYDFNAHCFTLAKDLSVLYAPLLIGGKQVHSQSYKKSHGEAAH